MDQHTEFGNTFSLTLLTDDPVVAGRADLAGVDHIGLDFETLDKRDRQPQPGAWISHHRPSDIPAIAGALRRAKLFARVDPWHDGTPRQVETLLALGVNSLMLPMFTTADEVARFVDTVGGRAYLSLLLETPQAMVRIDDILRVEGIDEVSVGLNDLHRGLGLKSHFELLTSDVMTLLSDKILARNLRFGFGTLGRAEDTSLPIPADLVYAQYPRLGASSARLFRHFLGDRPREIDFEREVTRLRSRLSHWAEQGPQAWDAARRRLHQLLVEW